MAQFRARSVPIISGSAAKRAATVVIRMGRKRRRRCLIDRIARRLAFVALGGEREVDHHDRVLLHDADQKNDADDGDDVEIVAGDHQGQQRAHAGRRQRRKDRHRMDVALVEHAQHDIDGDDGGEDQQQLVAERRLEGERRALEARDDARRPARYLLFCGLHGIDRGAQRMRSSATSNEIDRGRELAEMVASRAAPAFRPPWRWRRAAPGLCDDDGR